MFNTKCAMEECRNVRRHDKRRIVGSRCLQTCQTNGVPASFAPRKLDLPFDIFFYRAVHFSFDRYKNSIATQVRSSSAILAYLVRAASWPISKPRRNQYLSSRILPVCLLTLFARARVIHERKCVTLHPPGCNRAIFAACLRIDVSVVYL